MKKIKIIFFFCLFLFMGNNLFAAIDMTLSPIRYELELDPGESITKTASISNHENIPVSITTATSDFESNGTTGGPSFVRYSELLHNDQKLSTWINLSSTGFTLDENGKETITFTINVPQNATPGGYYSAVIFNNDKINNTTNHNGVNVGFKVDYAILILLKVKGEINTEIEVIDPIVILPHSGGGSSNGGGGSSNGGGGSSNGGGGSSNGGGNYSAINNTNYNLGSNSNNNLGSNSGNNANNNLGSNGSNNTNYNLGSNSNNNANNNGIDDCLIDLTNSNFDGNCIEIPFLESQTEVTNITPETIEAIKKENNEKFSVGFIIPIKNTGNTHIKPRGSITLVDENGNTIKGVGKKIKINSMGAVIGAPDIVDYLPINDNGGNVLPDSQRNFQIEWEGFPYQTYDQDGKIVMKNKSPGSHYSEQTVETNRVLLPWERVAYRKNNKKIKANIELIYTGSKGEDIVYKSAKEIPLDYTEKYIGVNPYIILILLLFIAILNLLWIIAITKRKKCINKNCRRRIKKGIKKCPHCNTKQKKK